MRASVACVVIAGWLVASGVRADVVDPPPDRCPPGSMPATSHSGPFCHATETCLGSTGCAEGQRCVMVEQCLETRACGGRPWPEDGAPCTITHVSGTCEGAGTTCGDEGTCTARSVCVGDADLAPRGGGCDCSVVGGAPGRGGAGAALAIAGLASMLLVRRRWAR